MALRAPRLLLLPILGAALAVIISGGLRPPLAKADDPKDNPKDDALPKEAKLRLGSARMGFRYAPAFTLLPPDFKTILIPDLQGGLRHYEVSTGRALDQHPREGTTGGPVIASRDGKRVAISRGGEPITVRDTAKGDVIHTLKPPPGINFSFAYGVQAASMSSDGKVLAQGGVGKDRKGEVIVWDVDLGDVVARVNVIHTGVAIPVLSPDGTVFATRCLQPTFPVPTTGNDPNRTVQVWSVETGKELFKAQVTGVTFQINGVAFSPNSKFLATSSGDGAIDIWDVSAGKLKVTLLGRTRQGQRVAFSPDGKSFAAVSTDGTIQRWSVADWKVIDTTEAPPALPITAAQGIDFVGNDRVIAWGTLGLFPVVWEAPSGKILTPAAEHYMGIKSIAFAAGGKEIITAGQEGRLVRWDAATGKALGEVTLRPGRGFVGGAARYPVTLAPDGSRALAMSSPATVFDIATGSELLAVPYMLGTGFTTTTVPSADVTKAITMAVSFDPKKTGMWTLWDLVNQRKITEGELPSASGGQIPAAAISPSGTRLVTATYAPNANPAVGGQPVLVVTGWDLKTGKKLGQVEDMSANGLLFVAVASDSSAIVSTSSGRVRIYDYESGRPGDEIETAVNRDYTQIPIVFSADGKRFAMSARTDDLNVFGVRVYDWPSGKPLHTFTGHRGSITAMAFSPDGKTLATGSQDTTVLLWDLSAVKSE